MADEKKRKISRRSFLRTTATGAVAVGALAAAPTLLKVTENVQGASPFVDSGAPVMAYVKDATRGTVVVMWGTKEYLATDPALVARLALYTRG